ncbi:MAG: GCN5-related N-acetyltransferase [Anaerocolumna sp.]|jgi:predicted GNAT family N-acyltransferase|nr:GCN5-related N-acetyltransferase [Anaerocolumna sp.]
MNIQIQHSINVKEYNSLRGSVNWTCLNEEQAQIGIDNTYYLVCARYDQEAVGMARVISDGGYVVYIADVVVNPAYQGMSIGRLMMEDIMTFIKNNLVVNGPVMVNLMAAKEKEGFYENFGFLARPGEGTGAGMTLWVK